MSATTLTPEAPWHPDSSAYRYVVNAPAATCWADVQLGAYARECGRKAFGPLDLCSEHHREIVSYAR